MQWLYAYSPHDGLPRGVELAGDLCNGHALSQKPPHLAFLRVGRYGRPTKLFPSSFGPLDAAVRAFYE
jgi:hypothetical protein